MKGWLNPLMKTMYLKRRGLYCPACGSSDIEGRAVEVEHGTCQQVVSCNDCLKYWVDIYKLNDIEEVGDE